jgi:uncharacterized membrane protein YfcA
LRGEGRGEGFPSLAHNPPVPLPLITDWHFYAAAIPAVILLGISKSGFGAGFGALGVPLMAMAVTVPQAAAILMPILFVIDVMGINALRRHLDWALIRFLVPLGLAGILVGTFSFKYLDGRLVAGIVGVSTLVFLAQRLLFPPRPDSPHPPRWAGGLLAIASGFTSFVAHAGSPPLNAYVIPMRLPPMVFAATLAVFFFVLNLSKWIPYAWLGLFDMKNLVTAIVLMPLAPLGVWLGLKLAKRISQQSFYKLVYCGMFLTGCKLVWDGFLAA